MARPGTERDADRADAHGGEGERKRGEGERGEGERGEGEGERGEGEGGPGEGKGEREGEGGPGEGERSRGGCLCGEVVYELHGPLRDVLFCHCVECRRWGGHAAAMTAVPDKRLVLVRDAGLRWIDSPDSAAHARRGFCGVCGSSLFWDSPQSQTISIAAGTLDGDTGVVAAGHIWVSQVGDYYQLPDDGLPRWPRGTA